MRRMTHVPEGSEVRVSVPIWWVSVSRASVMRESSRRVWSREEDELMGF